MTINLLSYLVIGMALFIFESSSQAASRSAETRAASRNNRLTNEPNGVISFEKPLIDFGMVKRGQKLTAKFPFKNIGKGNLSIQGVQASCNCTTIDAAKGKAFSPGETGVIEVLFDTTDYSGKVSKAISVITNERSMPDRTLTVTALVNSDIDANPPLVDFGDVVLNQALQQTIRLKNNMKTELKIERIRFNDEFLDVGYTKEGREFVIYVKLKPNVPIGFFKDTIWVKNNSSALAEMPIPVRATIKGQISASPAYIEFGSVSANDTASRQIALKATKEFEIIDNSVELNVNGSKTDDAQKLMKINVLQTDKVAKNLSLELKNPGNKSGSVHGKITLQTNNPQQKNLVVDFYAFFR